MKTIYKRFTTVFVIVSILFVLIPKISVQEPVLAASNKNHNNTTLGTSIMESSEVGSNGWHGNYVYFGSYENKPIKFRVLSCNSETYGCPSLFIDCDSVLYKARFDGGSNVWSTSEIHDNLNNSFAKNAFTESEYNSIADSNYIEKVADSSAITNISVDKDKIIILSRWDCEDYYKSKSDFRTIKDGVKKYNGEYSNSTWWLRESVYNYGVNAQIARFLATDGTLCFGYAKDTSARALKMDNKGNYYTTNLGGLHGVSPALNIDLKSILFSSSIGSGTKEYKLTVFDKNLLVSANTISDGMKESTLGTTMKVPYCIGGINGGNATRVSVLILDKEYTAGNTNGAKIIYYDELEGTSYSYRKEGTGSFTLPSPLKLSDWGSEFYVYVIAEEINYGNKTDYASEPVELFPPENNPTPTATPTPTKKPTATPTPTSKPSNNLKSAWKQEGNTWYYFNDKGSKVTGWQNISGTWYYFNTQGVMQTGWLKDGNSWYYLKSSGAMAIGWVQDAGKWYYMSRSGAMATGWIQDGRFWYYLGPSGAMVTGWVKSGSAWYYMMDSGAMVKGWKLIGGKWYYFDLSGAMITGWLETWLETGQKTYYLTDSGAMAVGTITIDGNVYSFDSSGALIK